MINLSIEDLLKIYPGGLIFYDQDLNIIEISDVILKHTGMSRDKAIGKSFISFIHETDRERVDKIIQSFLDSSEEVLELDFRGGSKDNKSYFVRAKIARLQGGKAAFMSVGSPIDELVSKNLSTSVELLKYKHLESIAKIGLWELDIEKNFLHWSDETYRIHKVPIGKILNVEEAIHFYHPEDRAKITEVVERCIITGVAHTERLRILDGKGENVWVKNRCKAIIDSRGKVIKIYGTCQDMTSQVELEHQKNNSQRITNSYKAMMDEFAIVAKTDVNGNISYVNDQFCKISKYTREELIGQNHRILNSGEHSKEFWTKMWGTISSGQNWRAEVCNRAKDGSLYWVDTFISPLLNEEKVITNFMAIRIEITDKKRIEREIEVERERATISSQLAAVGEISAGISHEINNPLTVISGVVEMMQIKFQENQLENIPDKIKIIKKSISRISKIMKGLKRVSHKSAAKDLEKVSMREIMDDTLDFSSEVLKSRGIKLIIEDLPACLIECHSVEISQVLLNLINNAGDAIMDQPEKWIKVQTFQVKERLRINVIDSGAGIPVENQEKIMESFFTTKRLGKGTGLGLSLSKRIIEEHHGEFFLDTKMKNTCFSFILPIAK